MERKGIYKWIRIFGLIFLILSTLEVLVYILFSFMVNVDMGLENYIVIELIFASGYMTPHAGLIWVISLCIILCFAMVGFYLVRIAGKKALANLTLARFCLLIGLFLILGGFIKMEFIVLLARSEIDPNFIFQDFVYNSLYIPLIGSIMWVYFTLVTCIFLVSGLIFGGFGLKWILNLQENPIKE